MLEVTTCGVGIKVVVQIWNTVGVIFLPKTKFFLLQIWWSIFPDFRVDHLCRSEEMGRNRLIKLDSDTGIRSSNDSVDRESKFMVPPTTWYLNKIAICNYGLGALVVFSQFSQSQSLQIPDIRKDFGRKPDTWPVECTRPVVIGQGP